MRGLLPIAAGFMLMPTFVFAQTAKQLEAIKKESNLQNLRVLQSGFKKKTLSPQALQIEAKKKGVVYSGESKGQYFELKGFDKKGKPLYYVTTNAGASLGTQTNKLNSSAGIFNLDGEGMRVHEWDGGGVLRTHQEFGGRVVQKDKPSSNSSHATHVAGTMVASGVNAKAKGMAPKANLDAYDWNSDETEMVEAALNGALLSNHSYGFIGGFVWGNYSGNTGWHWVGADEDTEYKLYGKYTTNDRDWDIIAQNAPFYLPVKAAGNPRGDGPEPGEKHYVQIFDDATQKWVWKESTKVRQKNGGELGYDSVNQGALGKNILTIGAANKINGGYQKPTDVTMASFSAFGPVDDGRIKPDIAGIGVGVYSTNTGGVSAYTTMGGTSMASPNVTGSLLLLQEHYKNLNDGAFMKAATVKALAIATANEAGDADGPDYKSGWGLLNAYKAATAISTNGKYALIAEKTLRNSVKDKISVVAAGNEPLVVTIAWTDPVPKEITSLETLNDRKAALVNDLDIRVKKDGEEFLPWKLDPANPNNPATKGDNTVDNVEQVVIANPVKGATYEIEISHKGDLRKNKFVTNSDGELLVDLERTTTQDYSVVVTGVNSGVKKDLAVTSVIVKEKPVNFTQHTPVEIEIENKGLEGVSGAKLKYQLVNVATGAEVFVGEVDLEVVPAGEKVKKEVALDLTKSFVDFRVVATVDFAEDEVNVNNVGDVFVYGFVADITADEASHSFGFEDDFVKNGWVSEDVDADGRTWRKYDDKTLAKSGDSFAINFSNKVEGGQTNDWMFSNPLKVKGGELYRVVFHSRKFQEFDESIELFYGDKPDSKAMTMKIDEKVLIPLDNKHNKYYYEFTPSTDQVIYVGFNNKTEMGTASYAVALDDVSIQRAEMKPLVDFSASKQNPNTFEVVDFTSEVVVASTQPVEGYEWIFEPAVQFKEGNANSQNPKVVFPTEGKYKVTLKVRNAKGESELVKTDYITAKNTATKAVITASVTSIYEGDEITFQNASVGNPMPEEFKWEVEPSEGVEFVTLNTAKNPTVKFNKNGVYTVKLTATSAFNSDTATQKDFITVNKVYNEVRDLKSNFDNVAKEVNLSWERPIINPMYQEGFETDYDSAKLTRIDGNGDGVSWSQTASGYKGKGLVSFSWFIQPFDVDDWLITPKLRSGAEVMKFMVRHRYPERYDVYLVEAPDSGEVPTVEQIKQGNKIHTFEATGALKDYVAREFDIKDFTGKDFFVAFHHRTRKADDGLRIDIDELEVGYDNAISSASKSGNKEIQMQSVDFVDYKKIVKEGEKVLTNEEFSKPESFVAGVKQTFGFVSVPRLTGYRIEKNDLALATKDGVDNRTHTDAISENGSYTYKVYGVYSDGKESEPVSVTIDIANLSTSDVKNEGLKIYPNPSDGRFVVEAGAGVTSLKAEVYDMSGKQIYKQDFRGSKADLNLTQYPKGVYILNLVDNNGKKQSAKLMIK